MLVAHQRILRGSSALLDVTLLDQNGEPADAAGVLTVQVDKADGTNVLPAGSPTTDPVGAGTYQRSVTAPQTAALDVLSAVWSDAGDASTHRTLHEIVGGFYFSAAELRAFDDTLEDTTKYPTAKIQAVRREVEEECELITGTAWVPRYRRTRLSGKGIDSLLLPDWAPRTIRSVRAYSDATTYTAFTAAELAALDPAEHGEITRLDGAVWTMGTQNLVVEYEHGFDRPPADLRHAAMTRCRSRLNMEKSGVPDRATSYVPEGGGGTFSIAQPGRAGFETGIPEVDAVYKRYGEQFDVPALA